MLEAAAAADHSISLPKCGLRGHKVRYNASSHKPDSPPIMMLLPRPALPRHGAVLGLPVPVDLQASERERELADSIHTTLLTSGRDGRTAE